jgi:elongation factor Tu
MLSEITYNLKAVISLLPTDMGGRKKPVYSGYRPSLVFNTRQHYSAEIHLLDTDELQPGNTAIAFIKLLPARTLRKNLKVKDAFTLTEGNKTIGSGVIEKVEMANAPK